MYSRREVSKEPSSSLASIIVICGQRGLKDQGGRVTACKPGKWVVDGRQDRIRAAGTCQAASRLLLLLLRHRRCCRRHCEGAGEVQPGAARRLQKRRGAPHPHVACAAGVNLAKVAVDKVCSRGWWGCGWGVGGVIVWVGLKVV